MSFLFFQIKKALLLKFLLLMTTVVTVAQIDDSKIVIASSTNGKEEASKYVELLKEAYGEGKYELHKTYADSLLLLSQLYDIKDMTVIALNNQAIYYKNRNDKEKAINIYHRALEKADSLPNNRRQKSIILVNMGNVYTDIGAYNKSIKIMDRLIEITDTISSMSKIKLAALSAQSTNYDALKDKDKFLEYSKRSLELAEKTEDKRAQQTLLNNLSDFYIESKDFKSAYDVTKRGLQLDSEKLPTATRAWLLLNNGIANYHLDSLGQSLSNYKQSLKISQEKKLYEIEMYCYEEIAKVYEKKGQYQQSFESQKEYSRLKNFIAKEDTKATAADLGNDIKNKENKLFEAEKIISQESKNKKKIIIYVSLVMTILFGLLLFYVIKKKRLEKENIDLRELYTHLKNETIQSSKQKVLIIDDQNKDKPYSNSSLTEKDRQLHKQRILQYIRLEKPYVNPELRLSELAEKLELSSSHFSEILHYCFEENFNNFINFYRVIEAQELMKKPDFKDAKIMTIAFDSGFKSKTTFNRVFKNYTGQTPSEYRKAL